MIVLQVVNFQGLKGLVLISFIEKKVLIENARFQYCEKGKKKMEG